MREGKEGEGEGREWGEGSGGREEGEGGVGGEEGEGEGEEGKG